MAYPPSFYENWPDHTAITVGMPIAFIPKFKPSWMKVDAVGVVEEILFDEKGEKFIVLRDHPDRLEGHSWVAPKEIVDGAEGSPSAPVPVFRQVREVQDALIPHQNTELEQKAKLRKQRREARLFSDKQTVLSNYIVMTGELGLGLEELVTNPEITLAEFAGVVKARLGQWESSSDSDS